MYNKKKNLIDYYSSILNAISNKDYKLIDDLSRATIVRDTGRELRRYMQALKEEALRKIFDGYIEAIVNNKIDEFLKDNNYESEKQLQKDITLFYNNWATEAERNKYMLIKKMFKSKKNEEQSNYIYVIEIKKLLDSNDNSYIEDYYKRGITLGVLNGWIYSYTLVYAISEEQKEQLEEKVQRYKKFRRKKSSENNEVKRNQLLEQNKETTKTKIFPEAKELIEFLISSGKSKEEFCKLYGIKIRNIKEALEIIKQCDEPLYNLYTNQINEIELGESKFNATLALQMEKMIENGVEEQDYIREFDIVDYYMITKTDPKYFVASSSKSLEKESQILNLRVILAKSYNSIIENVPFSEEKELNEQNSVLINGEPRLITKEEKQVFIDYLKKNNIPVTDYTYKTMKLRFINKLTGRNIKTRTYS